MNSCQFAWMRKKYTLPESASVYSSALGATSVNVPMIQPSRVVSRCPDRIYPMREDFRSERKLRTTRRYRRSRRMPVVCDR